MRSLVKLGAWRKNFDKFVVNTLLLEDLMTVCAMFPHSSA